MKTIGHLEYKEAENQCFRYLKTGNYSRGFVINFVKKFNNCKNVHISSIHPKTFQLNFSQEKYFYKKAYKYFLNLYYHTQ